MNTLENSRNASFADSRAHIGFGNYSAESALEPVLSVVIPTFNEEDYIESCLDSVLEGLKNINAEVLVIDGMSTDGTAPIVRRYEQNNYNLKVLKNKKRYQVHALNMGIGVARGRYIVRCDAHSIYPVAYFATLLAFYERDKEAIYGNVGLRYVTETYTRTALQGGIPLAMSSRIGVGVSHRASGVVTRTREVDTLLFGAWRRQIFHDVGMFDPTFIRGQDYEHNLRVITKGLKVALIPGPSFTYFTRSSFRKLRRMIYQYAYVKGQVFRKHGKVPNIRSQIPVLFFLFMFTLLAVWPIASLYLAALYSTTIGVIALTRCRSHGPMAALGMFLAVPLMHVSHAAGFIHGLLRGSRHQGFIKSAGSTR
ncbi:glycosyltransferase family 2 protein [Salinisphaera sp.]|uniref:glycosyltransferase family 2 protein n=1 Tax=Salinisphaera sp. TaxID=1914330 RepID=UPI002D79342C|nr:glycosyltransferase family 2 protein [Salinisphaera sp.]HET7313234.1 glycosyltransferase family 2 protein [Salinisphaera sp.]